MFIFWSRSKTTKSCQSVSFHFGLRFVMTVLDCQVSPASSTFTYGSLVALLSKCISAPMRSSASSAVKRKMPRGQGKLMSAWSTPCSSVPTGTEMMFGSSKDPATAALNAFWVMPARPGISATLPKPVRSISSTGGSRKYACMPPTTGTSPIKGASLMMSVPLKVNCLTPTEATPTSISISTEDLKSMPTSIFKPDSISKQVIGPSVGGTVPKVNFLKRKRFFNMPGRLSLICGVTCSLTILWAASSIFGHIFAKSAFNQRKDSPCSVCSTCCEACLLGPSRALSPPRWLNEGKGPNPSLSSNCEYRRWHLAS
mmetsp:Transcript_45768/g.106280  ORF Transcript_45768/g.106280 Transcript_45768/m.106280 type:complete len:313 (+) Transcript_45768:928-1866(+)